MKNANNMNKRILCERKRIVIDRKSLFNQLITLESKRKHFHYRDKRALSYYEVICKEVSIDLKDDSALKRRLIIDAHSRIRRRGFDKSIKQIVKAQKKAFLEGTGPR